METQGWLDGPRSSSLSAARWALIYRKPLHSRHPTWWKSFSALSITPRYQLKITSSRLKLHYQIISSLESFLFKISLRLMTASSSARHSIGVNDQIKSWSARWEKIAFPRGLLYFLLAMREIFCTRKKSWSERMRKSYRKSFFLLALTSENGSMFGRRRRKLLFFALLASDFCFFFVVHHQKQSVKSVSDALTNVISERETLKFSALRQFLCFCSRNLIILKLGRKGRRSWTERDSNNDLPLSTLSSIHKQHNRSVFERVSQPKGLSAGKCFALFLSFFIKYFSRVARLNWMRMIVMYNLNEEDFDM